MADKCDVCDIVLAATLRARKTCSDVCEASCQGLSKERSDEIRLTGLCYMAVMRVLLCEFCSINYETAVPIPFSATQYYSDQQTTLPIPHELYGREICFCLWLVCVGVAGVDKRSMHLDTKRAPLWGPNMCNIQAL